MSRPQTHRSKERRFEPKGKDENLPHLEDQFPRDPSRYHYSDHFRNKRRQRDIPIEVAIAAIEEGDLQDSRGDYPDRWVWAYEWCSIRFKLVFREPDPEQNETTYELISIFAPSRSGRGAL